MQPIHEETSFSTNRYQPNLVIQDYLLTRRLGGSEISATFQATHKNTGDSFVIKIFPKSIQLAIALYETEIKAFEILQGTQGILSIKDSGETEDAFFITTEFIQEGSIRSIFSKHPLGMEVEEALDLFTPIADTVDRIHGKNIIHRDLKPENILFRRTENGYQIFITDFGLVKFTSDSKLFQTETTAGTPWYIAPEAWITDQKFIKTTAVDIYSMGVMLYEALEGKIPFDSPADAIKSDPPVPEQTLRQTNKDVANHILKALSKNPEARHMSAGELIDGVRNGYYTTLDNVDQRWIDKRIRNYTIKDILGRGKMGVTMLANDNKGKEFVLKAFETNYLMGNPKQLFDKEIKSFQNLEAEHGVLLPRESFSQGGIFYIVFDYQSGGNLRKFFIENRRQMDVGKVLDVFTQIAEAIDYTHSKKIIHRDLKPENVVYRKDGERIITYLTDFGIAEILEGTKSSFYTKTAAGTFYYMAPEAWNPKARKTKAMDIYSFGVMLYEALEGHVPFKAEYPAIMFQHMNEQVPEPRNTVRKLGPNARRFLLEALSKNPEDRPKSTREIIENLKGRQPEYYGKRYGKYIVERIIGQSAIGATYRAIDISNKRRKVALKILPISEPINNEIEILKKLERHNGILPIIDSGNEAGAYFLVTEYMNGGNLREYLQGYPEGMGLEEALGIYKPIAEALDYLHRNGVIHRDLKPENIVLRKNRQNGEIIYEPFITDFGISRLLEKTPSLNTRTSVLAGTYKYIAPEVWDDQRPSPANDIYALGIMLYETVEGKPPFNARTPASIMKQHVNDLPPYPENLATNSGDRAARVLLRSLEKRPEQRQNSAWEFISELEDAAKHPFSTFSGNISKPLITISNLVGRARNYLLPIVISIILIPLAYYLLPIIIASPSTLVTPSPSSTLTHTSTFSPATTLTKTATPSATFAPTLTTTFETLVQNVTNTQTTPSFTPTRIPTRRPGNTQVKSPTPIRQSTSTPIPGRAQCNDGIDNDSDSFTDWSNKADSDPQCQNKQDDDESK